MSDTTFRDAYQTTVDLAKLGLPTAPETAADFTALRKSDLHLSGGPLERAATLAVARALAPLHKRLDAIAQADEAHRLGRRPVA